MSPEMTIKKLQKEKQELFDIVKKYDEIVGGLGSKKIYYPELVNFCRLPVDEKTYLNLRIKELLEENRKVKEELRMMTGINVAFAKEIEPLVEVFKSSSRFVSYMYKKKQYTLRDVINYAKRQLNKSLRT